MKTSKNILKIKYISMAVQKSVAKEVNISWSDYYPMCPHCGSQEVERYQGTLWSYCPECGQKIKNIKIQKKRTQPWKINILNRFMKTE